MTRRHTDSPNYNPASDRGPQIFGMSRRSWVRHVMPPLLVGLLVWLAVRARDGYDSSVADPPLVQSRFVSESLRLEKRRADFLANARVDSVISAERFQRINERFDKLETQIHCLSRPHPSGC